MPVRKGNKIDFLSAQDANELRKKHSLSRHRALYGLIEMVEKRIHFCASSGAPDMLFTVPLFVPDLPAYNPEEMSAELVKHFRRQNYYVRIVNATSMYVSWRNPVRERRETFVHEPSVSYGMLPQEQLSQQQQQQQQQRNNFSFYRRRF